LSLNIQTIVTGPFQENCYLLWREGSPEALFIDPGDDADELINWVKKLELRPVAIMNTHAHMDHIGAVQPLREHFSIPFYLHREEAMILNTYVDSCRMFGLVPGAPPEVDYWFRDQEDLEIENFRVGLLHTPGHTPGGTCFIIDEHVFVGDTLFRGSVGRTDLPGGDWQTLEKSLQKMITVIPRHYTIYSGHGPETSMESEIRHNPFLLTVQRRLNLS